MAYCPKCGAQVSENDKFCSSCGQSLATQQVIYTQISDDRWLITMLLCFFLGCLGIHRFYTGNTKTGVAMLLTCGGCGIWALIDFIMILCNTYTDSTGRTLK